MRTRATADETWMAVARTIAARSTCLRRHVGCVLIDGDGRVAATGYNGVARGQPHCNEVTRVHTNPDGTAYGFGHACPAANAPSGTMLDGCGAIHAEQNALMHCGDVLRVHTAYVTTSPCVSCVKMLLNSGCVRIVFDEEYPHTEAKALWESAGRLWVKFGDLE